MKGFEDLRMERERVEGDSQFGSLGEGDARETEKPKRAGGSDLEVRLWGAKKGHGWVDGSKTLRRSQEVERFLEKARERR